MRFLFLVGASLALAAVPAAAASPIEGLWTNPKKTMTVRIAPCGSSWCGAVVSATAKTQRKAQAQGVDKLIGARFLDTISPTGPGRWKGRVYIPRYKAHVGSRMVMEDPATLRIAGCFAGIICKTQRWSRVS